MCFTTKSQTETTTKSTPTAEETAMNKLMLGQYEEIQPQQTEYYKSSYDLANLLMKGEELPGIFNTVAGGISEDVIGEQASNYVSDAMPSAQSMGILDSGVIAKAMAKGVASDVLLPAQEYNSNLLLNLLNIATGQAAQGTNQFSSGTSTLAQQLAGLRSTHTYGQQDVSEPWLGKTFDLAGQVFQGAFSPK